MRVQEDAVDEQVRHLDQQVQDTETHNASAQAHFRVFWLLRDALWVFNEILATRGLFARDLYPERDDQDEAGEVENDVRVEDVHDELHEEPGPVVARGARWGDSACAEPVGNRKRLLHLPETRAR